MHENRTPVIYRVDLKVLAVLFLCFCTLIALISLTFVFLLAEFGFYTQSYEYTREKVYTYYADETVEEIMGNLYGECLFDALNGTDPADATAEQVRNALDRRDRQITSTLLNKLSRDNVLIRVSDGEDHLIASTIGTQRAQYEGELSVEYFPATGEDAAIVRTVHYLIPQAKQDGGFLQLMDTWLNPFYSVRFWFIALGILSMLTGAMLLVLLAYSAGHTPGHTIARPNAFDLLPTDLVLAAYAALGYAEALFFRGITFHSPPTSFVLAVLIVLFDLPLVTLLLMSLATRTKCALLVRNTLLAKLLVLLWRHVLIPAGHALRALHRFTAHLFRGMPLIWKALLIFLGLTLLEGAAILLWGKKFQSLILVWAIEKAILLPLVLVVVLGLRRLQKAGQALADGDLQYRVEEEYLPGNLQRHAQNLNSISGGMSKIVEERMKSERFRTELITNVSHDLKTPLTSIINYVDLLKKEPCASEAAENYLSVLDRQSARLKKLVEDLVEASKASTGNVTVHPAPCELDTMLEQALGEYEERMRRANLDPVLHVAEESTVIFADGRLLWRVFDNLLNNILKYTMPGTRVYLDLAIDGENTVTTFRNISVVPLNLPPEELMERFVRGDSSRHTEGSGLGLSIARSLTELMGGEMKLSIDGDLFKVALIFPRMHTEAESSAPDSATQITENAQ